ncbi:molybdopterin-guanine dinucleotide biosynthesis protein A [Desulfonatronum thiosulfatophilum]|uniref:Probable molybdenum cofactor guanylyltransferase n=1 Tax=Desulfonatronum thiosulfatophilum TaxID=617002 RepID=A0A1G6CVR6_9BACT|nr:molybdenum cofactor guanylyltransferase [Desulfonatronum thiosulfatophilum]SDB37033.1 molybdopterin-guanine dinucleotide biosynthesis protein A [Desulfonatronum thiosulfatophilum]
MSQPGMPAGIVLAGGKSTRLGHDKAQIVFSGSNLLSRTVDLLKRHCSAVHIAGRTSAEHGLNVPSFPDSVAGYGPAGGIATMLRLLQQPCLVLSCDLPLMNDLMLRRLTNGWREKPDTALMTTFQQEDTGYIEALVAIYEPQALPLLEQAFVDGLFQLNRILPEHLRHHLPYPRSEATPFFNVNHPADLSMLRQMESVANRTWTGPDPITTS